MDSEILNLMGQLNRATQAALQHSEVVRSLNIAVFPARILSIISRSPGRSQQELAEVLERDKAQVTRTLRELEDKGLITRPAHQNDWRALCPVLTEEGSRIATLLNQERTSIAERMMRAVSNGEKTLLADLLQRMLSELTAANGRAELAPKEKNSRRSDI